MQEQATDREIERQTNDHPVLTKQRRQLFALLNAPQNAELAIDEWLAASMRQRAVTVDPNDVLTQGVNLKQIDDVCRYFPFLPVAA